MLAVHRYYWPDTPPYASILRDIVAQWSVDGLEVEVMSSQPSYKQTAIAARPRREVIDGVTVRRIALRREHGRRWQVPFNIAIFTVVVAVRVLTSRRRFDVVMTSTAPPVVLAWAVSQATRLRGGRFIYHCMDVHPEIGRISGEFSSPLVFGVLQRLDRTTCATAAAVVVLSTDMAASLRRRERSKHLPIHVINNFELGQPSIPGAQVSTDSDDGPIRMVFTGNLGRFQGIETVIAALGKVKHAKVRLTLMGDGSAIGDMRELAAATDGADVVFLAHQDVASARALIASADLGLVSLTGGIHRFAYPSKTMTYLAEGCPIIAVVEPECELVEMLEREGLGIGVPPGDSDALANVLDQLADDPDVLASMRATARERGAAVFDKDATLKLWSRLVQDVMGVELNA